MSNSSLAKKMLVKQNYDKGRDGYKIKKITMHHAAGIVSIENLYNLMNNGARQVSSHYGIGNDGRIGQYVLESNTAWTDGNWESNCTSVTIETSNNKTGGQWTVGSKAMKSLINLVADIAYRNKLGTLVRGKNFTWHSMYASTACVPTNTEVLTENGWKFIKDVEIGDKIASADINNLNITFEDVYDKVPIKIQDTYTNNELTATFDHRMIYSTQSNKNFYKINNYGSLLNDETKNFYIPLAGKNNFDGIDLSDDMIKFYIAVQADGHYIKENNQYYGLEFHFKKERKIQRIKEILDNIHLSYNISEKSDGSTSIRVWNFDEINVVVDICEKYLKNKEFTWQWLNMSSKQSNLFLTEILFWDGCVSGNKYTSISINNLDIVNAIASINNIGSRVIGNDVFFRKTPYITINGETKRNKSGLLTEVTCVSVKTGLILIRQNGKTFIVGNCPGPYLKSKIDYIIKEANKINANRKEFYTVGDYKCLYNMSVRTGAGNSYRRKKVKELTADGKKNATSKNPNADAFYKKGTVFTVTKVTKNTDGSIWGKGYSGYVCLKGKTIKYCKKV